MRSTQFAYVFLLLVIGTTSIVIDSSIGSIQLLYQNDLLSNSTSTSALLLETPGSYKDASNRCSMLSESLLRNLPTDVQDQLNYLVYSGQLEQNAQLFIALQGDHDRMRFRRRQSQSCQAYHVSEKRVVEMDCGAELPALCTQSAPPYNITQLDGPVSGERQVTVLTSGYTITGYRDARSFRFLGIPFAQPPVGSLRFAPPLPYNGDSAISALEAGKACIQAPSSYGTLLVQQTSEDCLTLDIFSPYLSCGDTSPTAKKPVMLYFYGGSYEEGWSNLPDYDGGNLVSRGDVIVVTVNYRVGALGFLTTNSSINGNQGIQDQILALQWVQQHITDFGGDPSQVMIFGQSAGGQSVLAQLSSSASKGLFVAAVPQSSLLGIPFLTRDVNSHFITPALANATNCTSQTEADLIACLRALPAASFVDPDTLSLVAKAGAVAFKRFDALGLGLGTSETFIPITAASGGPPGVIDDQFQYLIGNDSIPNYVPVMIGTMRNEAGLFVPSAPQFANPVPTTEKEYVGALESGALVPNSTVEAILSSGLFPLNMSDPDGVRDNLVDIITSFGWQCPWQQAYRLATEKHAFPALYAYIFDKGVPQASTSYPRCFPDASPYQQICHTSDISEVFGRSDVVGNPYNSTNSLPFTKYVMDTWISFARTHDPQPCPEYLLARGPAYQSTLQISSEVGFPAYDADAKGVLHHFDLPPRNTGPAYPDTCAVYERSGGYSLDRINNGL